MTMFEAGKEYRTRDGRRARVYATDGEGSYPIHGAILNAFGVWSIATWTASGKDTDGMKRAMDLMPPEHEIVVPCTLHVEGTVREIVRRNFAHTVAANTDWLAANGWVRLPDAVRVSGAVRGAFDRCEFGTAASIVCAITAYLAELRAAK